MKRPGSNADPVLRWRDRPPGGESDEDRAAALARDAALPGVFPLELDERQLAAIKDDLRPERRGRPPVWLRAAVIGSLLVLGVTSVMGYEAGWFAPLRERLRFRWIPAAVPTPAGHTPRHASRAAPAQAPSERPAPLPPEIAPPVPPEVPAPVVAAPPPIAKPVTAPPARNKLVADGRPAAARAARDREPTAPAGEIQALENAMSLLRGKHDAAAALAALDDYLARFPGGVFAREAHVARVDALLMLARPDAALQELDALSLDANRRSTELQLVRGELRARTDCSRAEADFSAVLARVRTAALEERALYGRAVCRSQQGNAAGAAEDLRRYVDRFPDGGHAGWARRWLQNSR
jgi:TolA-binding protein